MPYTTQLDDSDHSNAQNEHSTSVRSWYILNWNCQSLLASPLNWVWPNKSTTWSHEDFETMVNPTQYDDSDHFNTQNERLT